MTLRRGPGQDRYLNSMAEIFAEAEDEQRAMPRPWAVHDAGTGALVGFAMISDNIPEPIDEDLVGPYFLWKLLIDERHQRHGYGREVARLITGLIREAGADDLLTSYVPEGEGGPGPFCEGLGFVPTGAVDGALSGMAPRDPGDGEIVQRSDQRVQVATGMRAN